MRAYGTEQILPRASRVDTNCLSTLRPERLPTNAPRRRGIGFDIAETAAAASREISGRSAAFFFFGRTAARMTDYLDAAFSRSAGFLKNFSRNAFNKTDTELKLIAAAAMIGLNEIPAIRYSRPAAIGMPAAL